MDEKQVSVSRENKQSSAKKWQNIKELLDKKIANPEEEIGAALGMGDCGFCTEFEDISLSHPCDKCPLFPKYCRLSGWSDNSSVFWRFRDAIKKQNWAAALELTKEMLSAIEAVPAKSQ